MGLSTGFGDTGDTQLYGGTVVRKDSVRIHTIGTLDELDAVLGIVQAESECGTELNKSLEGIQHTLYILKADLATPSAAKEKIQRIDMEDVEAITTMTIAVEQKVPSLTHFILPGGSKVGALLHFARTVCRRAERWVVALDDAAQPNVLKYINRLSDYLFVLARQANVDAGVEELHARVY